MSLRLLTHLIVAGVAAAAAWTFQDARMNAAMAEVSLVAATEKLQTQTEGRATERAISTTYQKALNDARTREALLRTDLERLHAASDGLRQQSADATRQLASAAPAAVLEYAAAVAGVFAECRQEYGALAAQADGHSGDVRTLVEAWPVTVTTKEEP